MGMRQTSAIEELLQSRKQRRDNPFGGDRARALASALSGMSASAGTYGGKMPQSPGFQEALKLLGQDEATTDEQLFENIKVAGLADEAQKNEARRARVLDPLSRGLLESRIKALPIEQVGEIDIRPDMTMGEVEDDPILGQFMKESLPKRPTVTEDIARTKEAERQALRRQPLSDIDRQYLQQKLQEDKIDLKIPSTYTYGDAEDNIYFGKILRERDKGGISDYQAIQLDRQEKKDRREEQRYQEQKEEKKKEKAKPSEKFTEQLQNYDNALRLIDKIEKIKAEKGYKTGRVRSAAERGREVLSEAEEFVRDIISDDEKFIADGFIDKPDAGYLAFEGEVNRNLADYIKRISGAASSDRERAFLSRVEVSTNDTSEVFDKKLQNAKEMLEQGRAAALEYQRRLGKDVESFVPIPGRVDLTPYNEPTDRPANRNEQGNLRERLTEEDKKYADWAHETLKKDPNNEEAKKILEIIRAKFKP